MSEHSGDDGENAPSTGDEPKGWAARWWWAPSLFGAAAVLLVVAAASPVLRRLLGEEFGDVPWWALVWPAAAAVLVLAAGTGARRSLLRAGGLGLAGAVFGGFAYLGGAEAQTHRDPVHTVTEVRPAAALLAAVACLLAAVVCLLLSRRGASWLPPAGSGSRRRRVRRVSLVVAWGAVGGIVVTTATGYGARGLAESQARQRVESGVDATARSVPESERDKGVEVTLGDHTDREPYAEPTKVLWDGKLPGPAALTTCRLDEPPVGDDGQPVRGDSEDPVTLRSTLVSVEAGRGEDAVVGYDTADGTERWRYTVRYGSYAKDALHPSAPGRLGQVGVSDFCTVHVLAGQQALVTLDGNAGAVLRETALPSGGEVIERGPSARLWRFTAADTPFYRATEDAEPVWQQIVPLGRDQNLFLQADENLAEVDQRTGRLLSLSHEPRCAYLSGTDHSSSVNPAPRDYATPSLFSQLCGDASYTRVPAPPDEKNADDSGDGRSDAPHRPPNLRSGQVPAFGCERPVLTDVQRIGEDYTVAGLWCTRNKEGKLQELDKRLVTTAGRFGMQVVDLPRDTPLPLRPVSRSPRGDADHHTVWIADGKVYGIQRTTAGAVVHEEAGITYRAAKPRTVYAGPEPLQAAKMFARSISMDVELPLLVYAVTDSGTVLALEQKSSGPGKRLDPELTPYAQLPDAAAPCEGTRHVTVDRAGLKLLTWCTTKEASQVTAVALRSLDSR